jgi:serine/threonine-protein kinase
LPQPRPGNIRLLAELIHIDLDFRLRRGEAARVEDYLERYPELGRYRAVLLGLIAAEYSLRRCWHAEPSAEEYLLRFPEYRHELAILPRGGPIRPAEGDTDAPLNGADSSAPRHMAPAPPLPPPLPQARPHVPGYQVLRVLGRGGMGIVYAALQPALGRVVALKTLLPGHGFSADEAARFCREAEAIAHLDHPNIVPIYEVGENDGRPYFTMKLYPGGSLAYRVPTPGAEPRAEALLVETVARAVHHAHQRGVLHRDLKPSNILLDESGQPHVADFGLAKRFDPGAAALPSGIVGTPSYIAPEQARANQPVTTASDVYGLGAILYELLTGEPPFRGETEWMTLLQVVECPPRPPRLINPSVPADLETVCLKCLEKDPAQRYQSAAELADDLRRWRNGEPIAGRPVGLLEGWWRWCRRKPREAAIAALALALLLLAVGGAWWLDRQGARRQAEQELLQEQARGRVRAALVQLASLRQRFLWEEAKAMLARAEREAADLGLEEMLAEVRQAQRELDLEARLDEIQLDRATIGRGGGPGRTAAEAYLEAFRAYGLDVEAGDVADLARHVRGSAIREELVAALAYCAGADARLRPRLQAVVSAVGPAPWADQLRGLRPWRGLAEQKARLASLDVSQVPPGVLMRLGRDLGDHEEVLGMMRRAQRHYPADFWLNFRLANILSRKGRQAEAIGYLQAAVALRPHRGAAYNNLAIALQNTGRLDEAIPVFQEAIRLDPDLVCPVNNFVLALGEKGMVHEAVAASQQALRIAPDKAEVHLNLGVALVRNGRTDEAIAAFRRAIDLEPDLPEAHISLGFALRAAGRFADALASLRRGDELGKRRPRWPHPSADWVRDCQRLLELDGRLPALLQGAAQPRDADEGLGFARVCYFKGQHATAARLYAEAFAAGAQPVIDRWRSDRSDAARSAARAAAPQRGELTRPAASGLRQQALDWLKAELQDLERKLEKDGEKARPVLAEILRGWQRTPDLAGVRDEKALAGLAEDEARAWRDFWKSVAARLVR